MNGKALCRALAALFIGIMSLGCASAEQVAAREDLWIYAAPSKKAEAIGALELGETAELIAVKGKWVKLSAKGETGFARKSQLKKLSAAAPAEDPEAEALRAKGAKAILLSMGDMGGEVKKLQIRLKALGYFPGTAGGSFNDDTETAVRAFQAAAGLEETGSVDAACYEALSASSAPRGKAGGTGTARMNAGRSEAIDWWTGGIQEIFARETVAVITDVETGISWREIRKGGTNHADVQPLTKEDTAAMKNACGGVWSWNRRAIWVSVGGRKFAASMNCMPHMGGSIENNDFDGHHCIHFTNSRTHGGNAVCALHQAAIQEALAAG